MFLMCRIICLLPASSPRLPSAAFGRSGLLVAVPMTSEAASSKRKEIYTYQAPWLIYGMNWSVRADQRFRLAIGSFEEEYNNSVRIVQLDEETHQFVDNGGFEHPYPTTKIMWMPDQAGNRRDLLATTGDYLRLWNVMDNKSVRLEALLNNNKNTEFCAPLTSFDWNEQDPNIIGTSSIDTTCIIWDIHKMQASSRSAHASEDAVARQVLAW